MKKINVIILFVILISIGCRKKDSPIQPNRTDSTKINTDFLTIYSGNWELYQKFSDKDYDWDGDGDVETEIYSQLDNCSKQVKWSFDKQNNSGIAFLNCSLQKSMTWKLIDFGSILQINFTGEQPINYRINQINVQKLTLQETFELPIGSGKKYIVTSIYRKR